MRGPVVGIIRRARIDEIGHRTIIATNDEIKIIVAIQIRQRRRFAIKIRRHLERVVLPGGAGEDRAFLGAGVLMVADGAVRALADDEIKVIIVVEVRKGH